MTDEEFDPFEYDLYLYDYIEVTTECSLDDLLAAAKDDVKITAEGDSAGPDIAAGPEATEIDPTMDFDAILDAINQAFDGDRGDVNLECAQRGDEEFKQPT